MMRSAITQSSINTFAGVRVEGSMPRVSTAPRQPGDLRFGKKNWGINELKQVLDIKLLHLQCHVVEIPQRPNDPDSEPIVCHNSISIWNAWRVRKLLLKLSKNDSETADFRTHLLQLAHLSCCKALHGGWDPEMFERFADLLHEAGVKEGRYLQDRKNLQDALRSRYEGPRGEAVPAPEPLSPTVLETEPSLAAKPKRRSAIMTKRDPAIVHEGPKPIIHCIRHAEAGNGEENDYFNRDPGLTEAGTMEAKLLAETFDRHDKVTHLMVSPLSRCIDTALIAFAPTCKNGVKITLVPELQAAGACWSCIGLSPDELREKYSEDKHGDIIAFGMVGEGWTSKLVGPYACDAQSVYERARATFKWCRDEKDKDDGENGSREIVLLTHQSMLVWFGHDYQVLPTGWTTWTFDDEWKVYETPASKARRSAPQPEVIETYSPASSTSSRHTIMPRTTSVSRLPKAPFSSVKYREKPRIVNSGSISNGADNQAAALDVIMDVHHK